MIRAAYNLGLGRSTICVVSVTIWDLVGPQFQKSTSWKSTKWEVQNLGCPRFGRSTIWEAQNLGHEQAGSPKIEKSKIRDVHDLRSP